MSATYADVTPNDTGAPKMKEASQLHARLDAIEAVIYALAHHLAVEAPAVAAPIALRVSMQAELERDEATRRLFAGLARLLEA
jgi:hypothetical protein